MSKRKRMKRERIQQVAASFMSKLSERLSLFGLVFQFFTRTSSTGTLYVSVCTCLPDGGFRKGGGVTVRFSDHSRKGDHWANFSRPARQFYGIWCFTPPAKVEQKTTRIMLEILKRNKEEGEA